jgi:hypothetical protein
MRIKKEGKLLVADDFGDAIWRVSQATHSAEKQVTRLRTRRENAASASAFARGPFIPLGSIKFFSPN